MPQRTTSGFISAPTIIKGARVIQPRIRIPSRGRFFQYSASSRFASIISPEASTTPTNSQSNLSVDTSATKEEESPQIDIGANLADVRHRIAEVANVHRNGSPVRLVVVSKTKRVSLLLQAYDAEQRHFGENYVQELVAKAPEMPADVKWHFIGGLQSNKAKYLVSIPNLYVVESVDRQKTAAALNKAMIAADREDKLNVMVQINTSGERRTRRPLGATQRLSNTQRVGYIEGRAWRVGRVTRGVDHS